MTAAQQVVDPLPQLGRDFDTIFVAPQVHHVSIGQLHAKEQLLAARISSQNLSEPGDGFAAVFIFIQP